MKQVISSEKKPIKLWLEDIEPEAFEQDDAGLVPALKAACRAGRLTPETALQLTAAHDWRQLAPRYRQWLRA